MLCALQPGVRGGLGTAGGGHGEEPQLERAAAGAPGRGALPGAETSVVTIPSISLQARVTGDSEILLTGTQLDNAEIGTLSALSGFGSFVPFVQ